MTANLLRIVCGAGKPYEIVEQTIALLEALRGYQKAFGHWPPMDELSQILSVEHDIEWRSRVSRPEAHRADALDWIAKGALQLTASRLIGQSAQRAAGEHEMLAGVKALENALKEIHREWALTAKPKDPSSRSATQSNRKGTRKRRTAALSE